MEHLLSWGEALIFAIIAIPIVGLASWIVRRFIREKWTGKFVEDGRNYSEEVVLYRIGSSVWGKSRLTYDQDEKKLTARYRIRGILRHAIITAYFEGLDNPERGAFLIKYLLASDSYSGKYLLIDHADGISMVEYSWIRSS